MPMNEKKKRDWMGRKMSSPNRKEVISKLPEVFSITAECFLA